jgi:hypothetical protein
MLLCDNVLIPGTAVDVLHAPDQCIPGRRLPMKERTVSDLDQVTLNAGDKSVTLPVSNPHLATTASTSRS